jgi:hypothetical protein|tara:strand:- start:208 stop:399 length:192 start_codon:yes stop_codon:yes gene_type:complete
MIKIERHVNFDNWINVSIYNKLVDQFSSRIEAVRFAKKLAQKRRMKVLDLDDNEKTHKDLTNG